MRFLAAVLMLACGSSLPMAGATLFQRWNPVDNATSYRIEKVTQGEVQVLKEVTSTEASVEVSRGDSIRIVAVGVFGESPTTPITINYSETELVNVSTRAYSGPGEDRIIAGFVLAASARILIRASGPTLERFGVQGAKPRVSLILFDHQPTPHPIGTFSEVSQEAAAQAQAVGAFALGENEAAAVVSLTPGVYSVHVVGDAPGVALVEVYRLQPPAQ